MRYTVTWVRRALEEIEDTRDAARGRELLAIEDAMRVIDRELSTDAPTAGESRAAGRRILIARPLAVLYEVLDDEAVVLLAWWCVP